MKTWFDKVVKMMTERCKSSTQRANNRQNNT